MSRMFKSITRTWPVFKGCRFNCTYCSARKLALTRLKHHPRYKDGFEPRFNEEALDWKFRPGEFVFVAYMGDISFCPAPEMSRIIARMVSFPETDFLLCSKDPNCFSRWELPFPDNIVLGTTLETNRDNHLSQAPPPYRRYRDLAGLEHGRKFVSIEPVMDFDLIQLEAWIKSIQPEIIEVGADNYHNNLPEPSPGKLQALLYGLRDICPRVIEKDGLDRLLKR